MNPIKIACLPVAGIDNPYQYLMIKGLNSTDRIKAFSGIDDKFWGIIRTTLKYKPDYIHFDWEVSYFKRRFTFLTFLSVPLFIIQLLISKYLFKVKMVWTPHNAYPHDTKRSWMIDIARRFLAKQCLWIRVFSENSILPLQKELKCSLEKFKIVPEGSYVGYYPDNAIKSEALQKLQLPSNKTILLFTGLIKPYKGIEEMIDAFYSELDENYFLIIAGTAKDKGYSEKIHLKLKNRSIFYDYFIPNTELQYFFAAADVVVLPFKKVENSGSVILAMGFAKAIIAPSMGVIQERLNQQEDLLFKVSIKNAFQELKSRSEEFLSECGKKNKEALEQYHWSDFAKLF